MNLEILQEDLKNWLAHNFPETTSDAQFKGIVEELGELARADLKTEQGIRGFTKEVGKLKAMDAVGDIVIYLINYCNVKRYSFLDCIAMAWADVSKRDWIAHPEGPCEHEQIETSYDESIIRYTGTACSICGESQYETKSGITCCKGHGGADPE